MTDSTLYLTQLLFVEPGKEDTFHEFEDLALPLLEKYNGKVIYRLRPEASTYVMSNAPQPYEIHFLSFASSEDFDAFLRDETRKEFLHLKQTSIRSSLLVKGKAL